MQLLYNIELNSYYQNIQIWLKSSRGAIDVFLCPDDLPGDESSTSESTESTASAQGQDEVSA